MSRIINYNIINSKIFNFFLNNLVLYFLPILSLGFITFTFFFFNSCVRKVTPPVILLQSDLEILTQNGKNFIVNNDSNYKFKGGLQQTKLRSRSGQNSVYSTPQNAFTLAIDFTNVYRDSYVDVSVWKQGADAHLVCVLMGTKKYFSTKKIVETDDNGWEKLNLHFYIPPLDEYNQLKFYLWNSGQDSVFYDDISLSIQRNKPFPEFSLTSFHLEIDTTDFLSLMDTRKRAFKLGVLQSKDDDWVEGFVFGNEKMMKAKLRLKGDWLDHLHGSKWSYRIKLKKDNIWNRMQVFSIQNPVTRLGVNEWFLHKVMISEGLLTTRYGFIPLTFNGTNMGLYAWEEHFAKHLLESQKRREGPIVRFVENALWDTRVLDSEEKMNNKITPVFDVAVIKPFSSGKVVRDTNLYNQFLIAQNLMMQYKSRSKTASEIFNIEMLAKYFAMADVFLARHSLIWHNQRFYYNPVICKLEPIAYDCYSDIGIEEHNSNPIIGFLNSDITQLDEYIMVRELFNDTLFVDYYIKFLKEYSDINFLDSVFASNHEQISYYDSIVKREYPNQEFFEWDIKLNAEKVRQTLPAFIKQVNDMKADADKWNNYKKIRHDYDSVLPTFFAPNLVLAYKEKVFGDSVLIKVKNFFTGEIIVIGVGKFDKKIREVMVPIPKLSASCNGKFSETTFMVSNNMINYMFFSVPSSNEIFSVEINQWPEPNGELTPLQQLTSLYPFPDTSLIDRIDGKNVFIKKGLVVMDHPVLIPSGFVVHFFSGTIIDLIEKAAIISHSPVLMMGTEDSPIVITSSDFTSNGFVVLQAGTKSIVNYVHFENQNTIDYSGWKHTGAVTFYESDVTITNTKFYRNQCEDALNIIRSNFTLSNSTFDYIFGDAFDADFCVGQISTTYFTNIGNDAMDFSGSIITIRDSEVVGAKDKGISGGEDSKLTIYNTKIKNANIGLASKDLSVVEVFNSKIESCNYGIVLFQKKPEYGPSIMILKNTSILKSKIEKLIEINSKVDINGKIIFGEEKNLRKIFY